MKERALFATKIGVIAATVGSAVGLGNFWRFPYEAGTHGGGAFLLVYLGCVLLIGIPVMCAEFIIGRGTHKNISGALKQLLPGTKYYRLSFIGISASILILSFYSVVAGWTMEYALQALLGNLSASDSAAYSERFNQFCSSNWRPLMWTLIFLFVNAMIILRGVQKGIE
ncbi:MAG: sodium-dependent transporter, partial [Bacteroidales bacterium]|nr:sodium-dependent transporter [Bacteroidales bacterium]